MKEFRMFFLIAFLLPALSLSGQEVIDKLAKDACDCMSEKDLSGKSTEEVQMEVSMCLMQKMGAYQSQLQEQLKVDMSDQAAMQELAQKIGLKMAAICPETMMKMATMQSAATPAPAPGAEQVSRIEGTIVGVEGEEFITLVLKEGSGRTQKFLWLRYFEGSDALLADPKSAVGKKVQLSYAPIECYSPKLNEYYQRNEIKSLKVIE